MPNGAQLIVELLEEHDVEVCFGLPGVHNLALWEALRDSPIRLVGVRHEQAAAYAADGYARATGKLGVAHHHDRPGRGEHARRGRGGVGGALAGAGDRDRHPVDAAAAGHLSRHPPRDDRPGGDVRAGREGHSPRGQGRRCGVRGSHGRRGAPDAAVPSRLPRGRHRPARRRRAAGRLHLVRAVDGAVARARRRARAARRRRAAADLGGHGRARRRRRGHPAGRAARGAGVHHLRGRRAAPAHASVPGRHAAARRAGRRAVGRGRPRARHRLGPRRRADAELRDAAAAGVDRGQPRPRGRREELPRRRDARGRRRGGRCRARRAAAAARRPRRCRAAPARRPRPLLLAARRPCASLPRRHALRAPRRPA